MNVPREMDGRRARGVRTRAAIIDALLELVGSGDLAPTAQRIADRAGVSVRSVYQHFDDVEGLYREAASRARALATEHAPRIDVRRPMPERIDALVSARSTVLEEMLPFGRASRLVEPSSQELRDARHDLDQANRKDLQRVFAPELRSLTGSERTRVVKILDLLTSWSAWDQLRGNGTSVKNAQQVMRAGVESVLGSLNGHG